MHLLVIVSLRSDIAFDYYEDKPVFLNQPLKFFVFGL